MVLGQDEAACVCGFRTFFKPRYEIPRAASVFGTRTRWWYAVGTPGSAGCIRPDEAAKPSSIESTSRSSPSTISIIEESSTNPNPAEVGEEVSDYTEWTPEQRVLAQVNRCVPTNTLGSTQGANEVCVSWGRFNDGGINYG